MDGTLGTAAGYAIKLTISADSDADVIGGGGGLDSAYTLFTSYAEQMTKFKSAQKSGGGNTAAWARRYTTGISRR